MKGFSARLKKYYITASDTEKVIIEIILKDINKIFSKSIHETAKITYSSASTLSRMVRNMGFVDYKDFQNSLLYEKMYIEKADLRVGLEEIKKEDTIQTIAEKVTSNNIQSLEDTKMLIDYKVLNQVVDKIKSSTMIAFFGMGASLLVAKDAYLKFLRISKYCVLQDDWHSQLLQANNLTENDIAIIFSYSGKTEEMIRCAQTAKNNGATVVAITGHMDSPLVKISDLNIFVASIEQLIRSGAMTSRIAQLNIVDIIYTKYLNDDHQYYAEKIQKTHIEKPNMEIEGTTKK